MRCFAGLMLSMLVVGCSGEEEGADCETFSINVTVLDVEGELVPDAIVELNNIECTNNGDGSYVCPTDFAQEDYLIVALHPAFSQAAERIPELPADPCGGIPMELQLGVMMGA